jgi:SCY1-like protein 1
MGNSASSLPYSIDNQVGTPHDHNGWAVHDGKSTDGNKSPVTVFVGKKPLLVKTPINPTRYPSHMSLIPAMHHYNHCRRLRHPHILKVYATLDTDNPTAASTDGGGGTGAGSNSPAKPSTPAAAATNSNNNANATTGDLIVVTEPCIGFTQWLLTNPTPDQLAWGLECIVQGLHFLHHSANLCHGNITPSSLYVTQSGDIKLWNFNIITPIGPNHVGPTMHFQQWEQICTPDSYRSPERMNQQWDILATNGGVHALDSYSLAILIDYMYQGHIPLPLQKAVQRMQTTNIKMRPRLQPLLKCPVFDTPYQTIQHQLQEILVQPVEQKIMIWQQLGQQLVVQQQGTNSEGVIPKDVALYKILPIIISSIQIICTNESMLGQDMYRRESKSRG